jgi:hypothetical protein
LSKSTLSAYVLATEPIPAERWVARLARMLDITERAAAAVIQMEAAAQRFNPSARIRLTPEVTFALTEAAEPGDQEVDCSGTVLLVAAGIGGVIDVGEHNAPVMLPPR